MSTNLLGKELIYLKNTEAYFSSVPVQMKQKNLLSDHRVNIQSFDMKMALEIIKCGPFVGSGGEARINDNIVLHITNLTERDQL